jgi:WS/DGAT/MGAT family acyltransferase
MKSPGRTPFAALDLNFWKLDSTNTHQAIASVCVLGQKPDFEQAKKRWQDILTVFPRLKCKVQNDGRPAWHLDPEFDLDNHVYWLHLPEAKTTQDLLDAAGEQFSSRLDLSRPPWRFILLSSSKPEDSPTDEGAHAFMISTHHALADGLGLYEVLQSICDSSREAPKLSLAKHLDTQARQLRYSPMPPMTFSQKVKSLWKVIRESATSRGLSPLNGTNSSERRVCYTDIELDRLKAIKKTYNVAVNDILLSLVAGAARRYSLEKGLPFEDLRIIMPVNMRLADQRRNLGNHLTGVGIRLPLALSDPGERLKAVAKEVVDTRNSGVYGAYAVLGKINSCLPIFFHRRICELQAKKTNFICTNVPGPMQAQYFAGAEITGHYGCAALMREHGIAFAFISYAQNIHIALVSDPAIVEDPKRLLYFLNEEMNYLEELSREKDNASIKEEKTAASAT